MSSITATNAKTGKTVLPDLNKPRRKAMPKTVKENYLPNGQLRTQFGGRIRLSDDDRKILKDAYNAARDAEAPDTQSTIPGSSIRTVTRWNSPQLNKALGFDDIVFSQIVNSRDPISLGIILKIQKVLDVEIVNDKYLKAVFQSYLDHIKENATEPSM